MNDLHTVLKKLHHMLSTMPALENACDDHGRNALQLLLDSAEFRADLQAYLEVSESMDPVVEPKIRLQLMVQMSQIIAEVRQPVFVRNGRRIVKCATKSARLISRILEQ